MPCSFSVKNVLFPFELHSPQRLLSFCEWIICWTCIMLFWGCGKPTFWDILLDFFLSLRNWFSWSETFNWKGQCWEITVIPGFSVFSYILRLAIVIFNGDHEKCVMMDCSPPASSVYGILQARILVWVVIPFSRGSSQPRDRTWVSCIAGRLFTDWTTRDNHIDSPMAA